MFYRGFDNYTNNMQFGENDYITNYPYGGMQNPYIYNAPQRTNQNWQKDLYPEIYNIIHPVISNICSKRNIYLNEETLENLTEEVYSKIQEDTEEENRNNNLLKDLIKILIIREFFPRRRPRPRPPHRIYQDMEMPYREFYHPFPEEYM